MPHSVASDLGLHWLPMSHKKGARLVWVHHFKLMVPFDIYFKSVLSLSNTCKLRRETFQ